MSERKFCDRCNEPVLRTKCGNAFVRTEGFEGYHFSGDLCGPCTQAVIAALTGNYTRPAPPAPRHRSWAKRLGLA